MRLASASFIRLMLATSPLPSTPVQHNYLTRQTSKPSSSPTQTSAETVETIRPTNRLLRSLPRPWKIGRVTKNYLWIFWNNYG